MPFEPFESSKVLGKQAQQLYTRHLNKLANEGITSKKDLLTKRRQVISTLKRMYPTDDDKGRNNKRKALSAIFWVLHGEKMLETPNNVYYKFFKRNIQNYQTPQQKKKAAKIETPSEEVKDMPIY